MSLIEKNRFYSNEVLFDRMLLHAVPVVGPAVVSPLVGLISLVKLAVGGTLLVVGKVYNALTNSEFSLTRVGVNELSGGAMFLAISVINIVTLGTVSFTIALSLDKF